MTSDISQKVYELVARIPVGQVSTYGDIAQALHLKTPRQVGWILHRNPDHSTIPCHRVVFADGSLTPSYAFGGKDAQLHWLMSEGVPFVNGKVQLKNCRYQIQST